MLSRGVANLQTKWSSLLAPTMIRLSATQIQFKAVNKFVSTSATQPTRPERISMDTGVNMYPPSCSIDEINQSLYDDKPQSSLDIIDPRGATVMPTGMRSLDDPLPDSAYDQYNSFFIKPERDRDLDISERDEYLLYQNTTLGDYLKANSKYMGRYPTVSDEAPICVAKEMMEHYNLDALLVTSENPVTKRQGVSSIVTATDYLRRIGQRDIDPIHSRVRAFISHEDVTCHASDTILHTFYTMQKHHFNHLLVQDSHDRVVGIISQAELVAALLKEFRDSNAFLKEYIEGKYC